MIISSFAYVLCSIPYEMAAWMENELRKCNVMHILYNVYNARVVHRMEYGGV